jgi:2,3-dihydroxyphenylpropionate 1,2-dioxygenase
VDVKCYEPIPEWVTGMGIVQFTKPMNWDKKGKSTEYKASM